MEPREACEGVARSPLHPVEGGRGKPTDFSYSKTCLTGRAVRSITISIQHLMADCCIEFQDYENIYFSHPSISTITPQCIHTSQLVH